MKQSTRTKHLLPAARTKIQTWLERLGLLALAAWLGIDDFDP